MSSSRCFLCFWGTHSTLCVTRGIRARLICQTLVALMCVCSVVSGCVTPWATAFQAPLSMEFSRQDYWSGLPFPPPELSKFVNLSKLSNQLWLRQEIAFWWPSPQHPITTLWLQVFSEKMPKVVQGRQRKASLDCRTEMSGGQWQDAQLSSSSHECGWFRVTLSPSLLCFPLFFSRGSLRWWPLLSPHVHYP